MKQRFLDEAPVAWKRWAELVPQLQGNHDMRVVWFFDKRRQDVQCETKSNGKCRITKLTIMRYDQNGNTSLEHRVALANTRYACILKLNRGEWVCTHLEFCKQGHFSERITRDLDGPKLALLSLFTTIGNKPLAELLNEPAFRIVKIDLVPKDGSELVRIEFEWPRELQPRFWAQHGTLVLDPHYYWLIGEAELKGDIETQPFGTGPQLVQQRFQPAVREGLPGLWGRLTNTLRWTPQGHVFGSESTLEFDLAIPHERDFTLSAFGLPEPPGVAWEGPTPWWLYGNIVGFALVILSGILYKIVGRWRTQATKPQTR